MNKYKMLFFGSCSGSVTGKDYSFSKGDIIDAPKNEFPSHFAEDVTPDFEIEKKSVDVSGSQVETASVTPKKRTRKK